MTDDSTSWSEAWADLFSDYDEDIDLFDRKLNDPRIAYSLGGGACPEQHEGKLKDGRGFYMRLRHGKARLDIGDQSAHDIPYPADHLIGIFSNQEDRDACFTRLLNIIDAPNDE